MSKLATVLTAIVFIVTVPASGLPAPVIGGDPIYTQDNEDFAGLQTPWALTIFSYVFDNTSASLPGNLALDPGEMLFIYLLDCDGAETISVDYFSVGNPHLAPINTVGWTSDVVPAGYNVDDHQDPYLYGYSGPAQAVIYTYSGNFFDPYCTLDPGEYSLVYYIAVAPGYTQVSATASGGGEGDVGLIPGPIPEPATVFLLGLGALALLRKRRQ